MAAALVSDAMSIFAYQSKVIRTDEPSAWYELIWRFLGHGLQ
jgi:hypothetical protein